MNNRAFTISIVVALLAVLMVHSYVTSSEETYKLKYGTPVTVVVAKKNIKELEVLNETNLEIKSMPSSFKEPGTAKKISSFKGGLAIAPMLKGEQVTRSKVTQLGVRTGLSRQVAVGKRAVTVKVNSNSAVSNLIKPGDRVDLLARLDLARGDITKAEIKTVLQDVLVLATGKYVTNSTPGILEKSPYRKGRKQVVNLAEYTTYNNVTLEVEPFQAQKILFIESFGGGVYLSLRNNDDNIREELRRVRLFDIMGRNPASSPAQK